MACLAIEGSSAARALAQAAAPFPEVPVDHTGGPSYGWAYLAIVAGAAMIGGSFALANQADDTYDEYLEATDPDEIERLYDRTVLYDRYAQGTLLTGEVLVVTGVYLRFIRRPKPARLGIDLRPDRCALALRF
jgi:hypothetical protein